jgi:hypothetical protein
MAILTKIDSNVTGLQFAEETSIGVLPGTPEWKILEPNSYNDFGGEVVTVARNPINASRQRKKGVLSDLNAAGGFNVDLVQDGLQDIMQGFFFADLRPKGEEVPTQATGTTDLFDVAETAGFLVNSLIFSSGAWVNEGNKGLHTVTAVVVDTTVEVLGSTLVTETPPAGVNLVVVGHVGAAGDLDIDSSGSLPVMNSTVLDFDTLGLIPGEWIYIGGDSAALAFATAANNGWARIKSISTNQLVFDKTQGTMVTEASTTETVQLFFGRVLKNENVSSSILRRTYNLERQLGAPDDALPAQIQSEYITGAVPSEITFQFNTADKVTMDMAFVGLDSETRDGATGVKSGNRNALLAEDAFNTSSDFSRLKMAILDPVDSNPTSLFAFLTEFTVNINNNVSPNKAISVLGAFEITAGQFVVSGSATAYFSQVAAIASIRANADVTLDFAIVKARTVDGNTVTSGMLVDIPLISLGDGKPNVEADQPITLPLGMEAGADRVFDHTMLMMFYDYLPVAADT